MFHFTARKPLRSADTPGLYNGSRIVERMAGKTSRLRPDLLRQLTVPVALAVGSVVALAWYVTWSTSDLAMALMAESVSLEGSASLVLFFALLVRMVIALMV